MTVSKIAVAMGYLDDELILRATKVQEKRKKLLWIPYVTATICLCVIACVAMKTLSEKQKVRTEVPVYGVLAMVTGMTENGDYEAVITGGDENFSVNDVVVIKRGKNSTEKLVPKEGDVIAITYSEFEKEDIFVITPGQIHKADSLEQ